MEKNNQKRAYLILLFNFFLWGSLYVGGRMLSNGYMSPFIISGCRCLVATVPLYFMSKKYFGTKIAKEDIKYFVAIAFFGYFLQNGFTQLAIKFTGATTASLINAMTPVAVTIVAALLLKEKMSLIKCVCLVIAVISPFLTFDKESKTVLTRIICGIAGVVFWGFASVYIKKMASKYPPVLVTAYTTMISLVFHVPTCIYVAIIDPPRITLNVILVVLYLGIIGSCVGQYIWGKCLSVLPASTCSMFYPLQPVYSSILAFIILKENLPHNFAFSLILASISVILILRESSKNVNMPSKMAQK